MLLFLPCPMRPHPHRSRRCYFSISLHFRFFFFPDGPSKMCQQYSCGNLAESRYPLVDGFWFLVCYAATLLALQLQQKRVHVVRSNRVARKRPARGHSRNGPWTHECWFEFVYVYVGIGFRYCNWFFFHYYYYVLCCCVFFLDFSPSFVFPVFFWPFCFFWSSLNVLWLRWMCCGGIVACYVKCTNVVKKW